MSWKEHSAELEAKVRALHDAVEHLSRRAQDARKNAAACKKTLSRLSPTNTAEQTSVNAVWQAMHKSLCAQVLAADELADRLEAQHSRLSGFFDSLEASSRNVKVRGTALDDEIRTAAGKAEAEKERHAKLVREADQARLAERTAEPASKRQGKLREEVERLDAEIAASEAQHRALSEAHAELQRQYTSTRLPQLLSGADILFKTRLAELSRVWNAVAEADVAHAAVMADSSRVFAEAAAAIDQVADMDEMSSKVQARMATSGVDVAQKDQPHKRAESFARKLRSVGGSILSNAKGAGSQQEPAAAPVQALPPPPPVTMESGCQTVRDLCEHIIKLGGLRFEGIFRLAEAQTDIEDSMDQLERNGKLPDTPNLSALVLKRWLSKKLPEPIIPFAQYEAVIVKQVAPETVFNSLPELNRTTIEFVFRFLLLLVQPENVAATKMDLGNLMTCFGPCMMKPPPHLESSNVLGAAIATQNEGIFVQRLFDLVTHSKTVGQDQAYVFGPLIPEQIPTLMAAVEVAAKLPPPKRSPRQVPAMPLPSVAQPQPQHAVQPQQPQQPQQPAQVSPRDAQAAVAAPGTPSSARRLHVPARPPPASPQAAKCEVAADKSPQQAQQSPRSPPIVTLTPPQPAIAAPTISALDDVLSTDKDRSSLPQPPW